SSLSESTLTPVAVADTERVIDRGYEYLPVSEFARSCSFSDHAHNAIEFRVRHNQFELDLGQHVDLIFSPTVYLSVTLLPSVTVNLADGHAFNAGAFQRFLDLIEFVGLN